MSIMSKSAVLIVSPVPMPTSSYPLSTCIMRRVLLVLVILCLIHEYYAAFITTRTNVVAPLVKKTPPVLKRQSGGYSSVLGAGISKAPDYTLEIEVGNPPQRFRVQIDTGSSDLALIAQGCTSSTKQGSKCVSLDSPYAPKQSSASSVPDCQSISCQNCITDNGNPYCGIQTSYADGSESAGVILQDKVSVSGLSGSVYLGALLTASDDFTFENDGIMGLAFQAKSFVGTPPALDLVLKANSLPNAFGMCLADQGGAMVFGAPNANFYSGEITWIPLSNANGYYPINAVRISTSVSGSAPIAIPTNLETIVDSGTTSTILPLSLYTQLVQQLQGWYDAPITDCRTVKNKCVSNPNSTLLCSPDLNLLNLEEKSNGADGACMNFMISDFDAMPTISFEIFANGQTIPLSLSARSYVRYFSASSSGYDYCGALGINHPGKFEIGDSVILGNTFMKEFYVHFDKDNSRIGFAKGVNGTCGSVLPPGADSSKKRHSAVVIAIVVVLVLLVLIVLSCVLVYCLCVKKSSPSSSSTGSYNAMN